jgi:hypothetical protein
VRPRDAYGIAFGERAHRFADVSTVDGVSTPRRTVLRGIGGLRVAAREPVEIRLLCRLGRVARVLDRRRRIRLALEIGNLVVGVRPA